MSEIEGFQELERRMMRLGAPKQIKGVARNAIRAGQRVVVKAIKGKIPSRYKDAKRAIGSTLKRTKYGENAGQVSAKVGAAVGQTRSVVARQKKWSKRSGNRRGVGLGARNAHWGILGTDNRDTAISTRQRGQRNKKVRIRKTSHPTGSMPAIFSGIVRAGMLSSSSDAANKIKETMADGIQKLAKS